MLIIGSKRQHNEVRVRRNQKGFTLIEIIISLLLASIFLVVVTPAFFNGLERIGVRSVKQDVLSGIRDTRARAMIRGEERSFIFDFDQKHFFIPVSERIIQIPEAVSVQITTAETELGEGKVAGIRFYPDGSSTGGNIHLITERDTWIINVAWLTGKIELAILEKGDERI